jgi:hypothetical protein
VDTTGSPLAAWESFYVIVGSSAGALIGLQFVVIALIAETQKTSTKRQGDAIDAFGTPTILHFVAVLFVSLIASAPWPSLSIAGVALGISGGVGLVYVGIVIRRVRRQTAYQAVMEDWIWHMVLPLIAYGIIVAAAFALRRYVMMSLFAVAGAALILLCVGIHNAWDSVTYIAVYQREESSPAVEPRAEAVRDAEP